MEEFTNSTLVLISQYIRALNHHIAHLKQCDMPIISVNLEKKNTRILFQPRKQGYPSMIVKDLPLVFLNDKIEL